MIDGFLLSLSVCLPKLSTATLDRKPFFADSNHRGSKRSPTVSAEAKFDGLPRQDAKIGVLVYTLC